jgi:hypothetical protein
MTMRELFKTLASFAVLGRQHPGAETGGRRIPKDINTDLRRNRPRSANRSPSGPTATALLALAMLLGSASGYADIDPYRLYLAERGEIPWNSLSREEQEALKRHRGEWDGYSGERQRHMREGAQRYLDLPPEKRREVDEQRKHYQQLSPQERERLREEYRRKRD